MAMKLYPPVLEGALPAFYGTEFISVPFSMNRAVGASEVAGFYLKIKTVSGTYIDTLYTEEFDALDEMYAKFDISNVVAKFNVGQYYKVQLAYVSSHGETGYYSTVGVTKYTTEPTVSIENFAFGQINQHNYSYVGVYSQEKYINPLTGLEENRDTTEKLFSSRFIIYDGDGTIFADSGDIIHKTQNDSNSYIAHETYLFSQDLAMNKTYYVKYIVKTTNGLEISSPKYRVIQRRSVSPDIDVQLKSSLDYDNGQIKLSIINNPEKNPIISGAFLLSRASSKNGFVWEEFKRFDVQSMIPEEWGATDCTIEQGVTYKYSMQQYNENGVYSDRIISNSTFADFEDAFLYDGEKQLRIRYNPKVSSIKNNIQETKVDTIGSQHPFIVRNGNVNYKDFPISGLISYHMDDTHTFFTSEEFERPENNYSLDGNNMMTERQFKLAVLDWLTDGKPKLFRSPAEGNYIVRLMNVSLSPNDTLGRMLHTFSATAYEIAKYNSENLGRYGLIDTSEDFTTQTRWVTIDLQKKSQEEEVANKQDNDLIELNTRLVKSISFSDMRPGTIVYIDELSIMIGATGAYRLESENSIFTVKIAKRDMNQGLFTYSYQSKAVNVFNLIDRVHVEDVPCLQYAGAYPFADYNNKYHELQSIFNLIEDVRTQVLHVSFIRFLKRDVQDVYINLTDETFKISGLEKFDGAFYSDMNCTNPLIRGVSFDPIAIYHLRLRRSDYRYHHNGVFTPGEGGASNNEDYIIDRTNQYFAPYIDYYYDPQRDTIQPITPALFDVVIEGEPVNIAETGVYHMKKVDATRKPEILINDGIIMEISYAKQIMTYSMEDNKNGLYPFLVVAKQNYVKALEDYKNAFASASASWELNNKRAIAEGAYQQYINELEIALKKYKEENGIL
jgi:hypothetical protein